MFKYAFQSKIVAGSIQNAVNVKNICISSQKSKKTKMVKIPVLGLYRCGGVLLRVPPPHLWGFTLMTHTFYVVIISYRPNKGQKWHKQIFAVPRSMARSRSVARVDRYGFWIFSYNFQPTWIILFAFSSQSDGLTFYCFRITNFCLRPKWHRMQRHKTKIHIFF